MGTAKLALEARNAPVAAGFLEETGAVAQKYSIVPSRGKSDSYFPILATMHAKVAAATKRDPLQGSPVGYEFGKSGGGFYALQEQRDSMAGELPVTVEPNETVGLLLLFDSRGNLQHQTLVVLRLDAPHGAASFSRISAFLIKREASPAGASHYSRSGYLIIPREL